MKKENWLKVGVFVGVATIVGVAGHYWLKKQERKEQSFSGISKELTKLSKSIAKKTSPEVENDMITSKDIDKKFPIQLGDQGEHITQVQAYLLKHHGWAEVTMGTYDSSTARRVKRLWKVDEITEEIYKQYIKKPVKLK